jgi:hypothetical protein
VDKNELPNAVKLWPTAHGMGSPQDPHGNELSMAVAVTEGLSTSERSAKRVGLWPTATAQDAEQSGSRALPGSTAHPGTSLTDAAVRREWMTPSTRDYKDTPGMSTFTEERHAGDQLPRQVFALDGPPHPDTDNTTGRSTAPHRMLNASWVFQLMGYPATWARLSTRPASRLQEIQLSLTSLSQLAESSEE